jgi:hypothetical protein
MSESDITSQFISRSIQLSLNLHTSVFEHHHRFAGWLGLACVWTFVILSISQVSIDHGDSAEWQWSSQALVHSPQFWFALFITIL